MAGTSSSRPTSVVVNYGGTDINDDDQQRRRSTISVLRQSIATNLHSHTMSTLALCSSVFSFFYLLMSAFPYSGFMSLHLVPGLTHESVGTYAGMISGSFMIGRLFSSWPWGAIADTYGRKFVLLFSTFSSAILMLAFGFAPTFGWALGIRFLTGLCNGTMIAARVSVSELARGDHDLEAKGMGLVMSMVGFGMLCGPALGGILSEPVKQYDIDFGPFQNILTDYPFALPNIVGAIISTLATILIALTVEETLPPEKLRSTKHIIPDVVKWIVNIPKKMVDIVQSSRNNEYESVETSPTVVEETSDCDSIEEDLKIIGAHFGEGGDAVVMCTRSSRASFIEELHRPSTATVARASIATSKLENIEEARSGARNSIASHFSANITSLMNDDRLRSYLNCYWVMCFASTTAGECFPLFCMAKIGGLGIEETAIGLIGSGSGLLFVICQYFIFTASMTKLGLHKTMVSSALLAVAPVVLIPVSLLFKTKSASMIYLMILNGITSVAFSNWNAAITITQNRAVEPSARSKLNGLAAIGGSVGRGFGPLFAGILVTMSYTNGIIPTEFGSVIIWSVVSALGIAAFSMNAKIKDED